VDGTTAWGWVRVAEEIGFETRAIKADMTLFDLPDLTFPFVAHVLKEGNLLHYYVVIGQDKKHKKYETDIKDLYLQETGKNIDPTETDIRKYELWEEQSHKCLYTGAEIGIADFLGDNPKYDIEHKY